MTVAVLWIVRALVLLFILRFVLRLLMPAKAPRVGSTVRKGSLREGGTLVRDPQCGTYVPRTSPFSIGRGESAVAFCSVACRDAWQVAHAH